MTNYFGRSHCIWEENLVADEVFVVLLTRLVTTKFWSATKSGDKIVGLLRDLSTQEFRRICRDQKHFVATNFFVVRPKWFRSRLNLTIEYDPRRGHPSQNCQNGNSWNFAKRVATKAHSKTHHELQFPVLLTVTLRVLLQTDLASKFVLLWVSEVTCWNFIPFLILSFIRKS